VRAGRGVPPSDKKPRVVMSLGPDKLPSLSTGDRLQATGEVEVTTDCLEESVRCLFQTAKPGATAPAGDVVQVLPGGGLNSIPPT
jgi:hypothetical protein